MTDKPTVRFAGEATFYRKELAPVYQKTYGKHTVCTS